MSVLRRRPGAVLFLYWLSLLPAFATWLWIDRTYAPWDFAYHSYLVMRLHDGFVRGNLWRFYELDRFYPPLFHLLALPASFVTDHPDAFCFGNWLALLALLCATRSIGASLAGPMAGLAAALVIPGYIYVAWMGRMPMTDLTLTATVAWTLALLVRPIDLENRRQARQLGLAIGLGMLAKLGLRVLLAAPLLALLVSHLGRARRAGAPARWWPLIPVVLWATVLAAPWYVRSLGNLSHQLAWHLGEGVRQAEGDPPAFSYAGVEYYESALATRYMSPPLWILLVLGLLSLAVGWRRRRDSDELAPPGRWLPLFLSAAGGLACLLSIGNKDERYLLPFTPVLAVVSTAEIARLAPRVRRGAVVGCGLLGYALALWSLFVVAPPDPTDWRVTETAAAIADDMAASGRRDAVLVVPNEWHMNFMSLDYAVERRLGERIETRRVEAPLDRAALAEYGYAVLVLPPPEETVLSRHSVEASEVVLAAPGWSAIASFTRGDGREVRLMARRPG